WGVGVYLAGVNRQCDEQPNLTSNWVAEQSRKGWRILPLTVGRQAACTAYPTRIDDSQANSYAAAKSQGRAEAVSTVAASEAVGLPKKTTHWLDIEDFDVLDTHCRRSVLAFISGWTSKLHKLGYRSGLYSNAAAAIQAVEGARTLSPGSYNLPDQLWFAHYNGQVSVKTEYLAKKAWAGERIHQYSDSHNETHGGVTINVDSNWTQVGGGTKSPRVRKHCHGVRVDFPAYGVQRLGSSGDRVRALQCLLREERLLSGDLIERFDRRTSLAVKRFQRKHHLRVTGKATKATWVALLSDGSAPLAKVGSGSDAVRRLQRALNAATTSRLPITGVYDRRTERAVKGYQGALGFTRTGVTTTGVWSLLHAGRA
ncbi:MAG TPA: glycoside hydrolase domain-containing protein, partial [Nocardioidaceae bacterium]|nr:glycoside hydrolase domain-containing protein [Nocardioidaceae bacterium]